MTERRARKVMPLLVLLAGLAACDRDAPLDTVADPSADAGVWLADARKVSGALPRRIGSFEPAEGADPFSTTYATGPVFGSSCTYADGQRQLVVRIETGNVAHRAATALEAAPGARAVRVNGSPGVVRWTEASRVGQMSFLVARRYLVELRLVPANGDGEMIRIAESIDTAALTALVLDGVTR